MRCSQCQYECPPEFAFCPKCGTSLGAAVAARETLPERIQRLIPKEYAQRLLATRGQVHDERRTVTILFSDVKGSTAMAEDLDPEEVIEIMRGAFDVLIEPVYRYEGTLARLMGDAVLAFFGAPIAHEDDPERACRAALDIIQGAQEYAKRLEHERGLPGFNVRVGIHTGLVVVGEVGSDLRVEYTAMGDAINLAARMESAAEPGTVLISEATHKLIAPLFETEPLGPIQAKGKAEPVPVYRVLAAKAVPGKARGIAGLQSPLVGREAEFAALHQALDRVRAGVGGVVTIVGEAGIGKSRLVAESRALCEAEARKRYVVIASEAKQSPSFQGRDSFPEPPSGRHSEPRRGEESRPREAEMLHFVQHDRPGPLQWIEGRCLSYGTSISYLLWLDVLRGLLGVTLDYSPEAVRDKLRERLQDLCTDRFDHVYPYIAQLLSLPLELEHEAALRGLGAHELKIATFQAVETWIQCAARQHPLVLVCEDLHWVDPTSLELLERLLGLTARTPLLLLCVFRPDKEHGAWRLIETAAEQYAQRHTDLRLEPLSSTDSEALVDNLIGLEGLPHALTERILSRAEGNPFYVEEVIRSLIDRGAIVHDEASGRWQATAEVATIPIPDTLHGVLMARIDRLQEDARRVLQMASVIGRIFLYRVLAAIAEEERRLDDQLMTLQYQEMIRERTRVPELEYIFKHELTREAAYNGLLRKERRAFHRQVAEALEGLYPERVEEQAGLLAHHWERAGNAEKAIHYLQRAGQKTVRVSANQEAIAHFTKALELLGTLPDTPQRAQQEFVLQLALSAPLIATRGWGAPEVGRACRRARELSRQMGQLPQMPTLLNLLYQFYLIRAEHQTALELAKEIVAVAERGQDPLQIAFPLGSLGTSYYYIGQLTSARACQQQVLASYDPETHRSMAFVYGQDLAVLHLGYQARTAWLLGYPDQAVQLNRDAIALAQELDHPFSLALAFAMACWTHTSRREVGAAGEWAEATIQIAARRGFLFFQSMGLCFQGWVRVHEGAVEEGMALIHQAMAGLQATGTEFHRPHFLSWLTEGHAKAGQVQEGLARLAEALALVEKTGERYHEAEIHRLKGDLLCMQGHEAEAEAEYEKAIQVALQQEAKSLELRATVSLCRLRREQGKRAEAREMLAAIYGWFTEGFDTPDLKEARALLDELS